MARLVAPIQGRLVRDGRHLTTPYGHDLESPFWQGAEIGFLESGRAAEEAAREVLGRGLVLGVHYPIVQAHAWDWAPFWLAPDAEARRTAQRQARTAMARAAELGASYILFHYPWPALLAPVVDYEAAGWKIPPVAQAAGLWPRARLEETSERILRDLERAGKEHAIRVVLELDGPNAAFFEPEPERDLCSELFAAHPGLDLCVDTGRFGLLARQHGGDPYAYAVRWLEFTGHLHLHGASWDRGANHLPPLPEHEDDPGFVPAAAMARLVLSAHPDALVVLETDLRGCGTEVALRSMRYCASL